MTDRRSAWAEIDLAAVRHNVSVLAAAAAGAQLMAVVKANAYGHGAVPVGRAALEAGASWLGVARAAEGTELRAAGIDAPVMMLSDPPADEIDSVVDAGLATMIGDIRTLAPLGKASRDAARVVDVHLKVDTGMHRVGLAPESVPTAVDEVLTTDGLTFGGIATHLAVADDVDDAFTAQQLDAFRSVVEDLERSGRRPPLAHAANSAGVLAHPDSHFDLVRTGISIYGLPPGPGIAAHPPLRPALSVHARVSAVRDLEAGERVSYGRRYVLERPGRVATIPLGYGDGVPRRLGAVGGEVLIGGVRRPIAGTVTMDQFMVDVGAEPVDVGDHVVLIGAQEGPESTGEITATEWADRLDTIDYEIVTGIRRRVPRVYTGE